MKVDLQAGCDYLIPDLGIVHVDEVKDSGACVVIDQDGRRWLVSYFSMDQAELCLFS